MAKNINTKGFDTLAQDGDQINHKKANFLKVLGLSVSMAITGCLDNNNNKVENVSQPEGQSTQSYSEDEPLTLTENKDEIINLEIQSIISEYETHINDLFHSEKAVNDYLTILNNYIHLDKSNRNQVKKLLTLYAAPVIAENGWETDNYVVTIDLNTQSFILNHINENYPDITITHDKLRIDVVEPEINLDDILENFDCPDANKDLYGNCPNYVST